MVLLLGLVLVSIATGYALGGRLRRFELLSLRWWALAPIGFVLQLLPVPHLDGDAERLLGVSLLIGSYVLLLVFVAVNVRIAGFPLLFIGLALNFAVISANGGMPVSREALEASGQSSSLGVLERGEAPKHHLLGPEDVLSPLGDVIAIGNPMNMIVSIGDVVVYVAIAWILIAVMRGRTRGLALDAEQKAYRGRHRRRGSRAATPPHPPPAEAKRSGSAR